MERDRFKQHIAISLALLVVVGAGTAILQVQASNKESNSARQTTRIAVQAMRANVVADTVAGVTPELEADRDFLAFRRPLTPDAPSLAAAAGVNASQGQTTGSLLIARHAVPDLGADKLLPSLETGAQRLTLSQRALATTRITWNDRSTQYTTVIAVLAVAIFLVGFGLVVGGPIRGSAYTLGLCVGLFAAAWAGWIYFLPIPSTPATAIEAAARGAVLTQNGHYRAAVARYEAAVAAKGDYATAYAGLSRARLLAANPDYQVTGAVTDLSSRSISDAVLDARKAHVLDSRDILSASLLGLTSFFQGDYEQALEATDAAIGTNSSVPDLWLLASAIQAARGDQRAANAALSRAVRILRGTEATQRTRLLASTYLNYLAWLERYDPAQAAAARKLTNRVVAVETAFTLNHTLPKHVPTEGSVSVTGLRYAGGKLTMTLRWAGLPPGTALSGLAYERPLPHGAWTQPPPLALFATVSGAGQRDISVPLKQACRPTSVRVNVYLNGRPTLTRTGPGARATC
ncbi:MAG TPA: tetratricopeptide repeat protein [Solirubrobacterales bacterium]|nr:tetratricopeptide repeat protein [Solirubrobacterales bacterium]